MSYCDDCGERVYNGACTNCHEEIYIADQYREMDMAVPKSIEDQCCDHEQDIQRKRGIKETF